MTAFPALAFASAVAGPASLRERPAPRGTVVALAFPRARSDRPSKTSSPD
ncbi:MAG: hypothetical protein ABEH47_01670 [Haloferacaceae archaeon]